MNRADDARVWMVTGALGSMALAVALTPLRTQVAASNLAFVFMAFTIIVAELGGRAAALVTALISAMSLNFFLTEPYLTLAISKTDDVIAFFALAACGLIAAAFGRRRERLSDVAGRADRELATLARFAERSRAAAGSAAGGPASRVRSWRPRAPRRGRARAGGGARGRRGAPGAADGARRGHAVRGG